MDLISIAYETVRRTYFDIKRIWNTAPGIGL